MNATQLKTLSGAMLQHRLKKDLQRLENQKQKLSKIKNEEKLESALDKFYKAERPMLKAIENYQIQFLKRTIKHPKFSLGVSEESRFKLIKNYCDKRSIIIGKIITLNVALN